MTPAQEFHAAAMMQTGIHGSFAAAIGEAYTYADPTNRERLTAAFPELFARVHQFHRPQLEVFINE